MRRAEPARANPADLYPVVLLHQTPRSSVDYATLMHHLGSDRLCVAPDTPGFGLSDGPAAPLTIAQMAEPLVMALDHASTSVRPGVDLVGFHTGALLALHLAVTFPQKVRRLVLIGVPFVVGEERATRYQLRVESRSGPTERFASLEAEWTDLVERRPPSVSLPRAQQVAFDALCGKDRAWHAYHAVFTYPTETVLPRVRQPALVIAVNDLLVENTRRAARLIPGAHLCDMLEASGSWMLDTHAAELSSRIRAFL